jgi:Domain of unknown function (DUF1735)
MKTFNDKFKLLTGGIIILLLVTTCIPKEESMGDAGQTLVKLIPAGFIVTALNPVSSSQTLPMFEVRRDLAGPAALNKKTTVTLQFDADTSILNAYNNDNGTYFIPLPTNLHSTTPDLSNSKITVTFDPGEYIKTVTITVPNAFNFDFTQQYALAYSLTEVSGEGKKSKAADSVIIVQILAKNKYDGVYMVSDNSPMLDVVNPALTGNYPFKYKLMTTGENTCDVFEFDNDYPLHPILSNGNPNSYGAFCPALTFSETGNGTITAVDNYFGANAGLNMRNCVIDPSGINKWDAATKTIALKYIMIQKANTTLTAPWYRTFFDETWTYIGPR